jgi:hypothetical protein
LIYRAARAILSAVKFTLFVLHFFAPSPARWGQDVIDLHQLSGSPAARDLSPRNKVPGNLSPTGGTKFQINDGYANTANALPVARASLLAKRLLP